MYKNEQKKYIYKSYILYFRFSKYAKKFFRNFYFKMWNFFTMHNSQSEICI